MRSMFVAEGIAVTNRVPRFSAPGSFDTLNAFKIIDLFSNGSNDHRSEGLFIVKTSNQQLLSSHNMMSRQFNSIALDYALSVLKGTR
jgi:hypothetical protein